MNNGIAPRKMLGTKEVGHVSNNGWVSGKITSHQYYEQKESSVVLWLVPVAILLLVVVGYLAVTFG